MSLIIKDVSKSYDDKPVISNLSYEFPSTGVVAITGASGAGKTTLLRIISGLERNFSGEVIKKENAKISFAFQEHRLFPNLTALENIVQIVHDAPCEQDVLNARTLLSELGFSEHDMSLYPSELSGGMKQRVSLARAFLRPCSIMLLDEPTKELDGELVKKVLDIVKNISRTCLVIIVTHNGCDIDYLGAVTLSVE